jgi:hypothetical protein
MNARPLVLCTVTLSTLVCGSRAEAGTIDLSTADAKLVGEEGRDSAGAYLSGAGDVDGDGHDDLLVGAIGNDEGGRLAGAAYLVRGPVAGTVDLSMADAKLVGEDRGDGAGRVAGAGDVDGDGLDDLLVGAPWARSSLPGSSVRRFGGVAYVVLGPVTGTLDLSLADAKLLGSTGEAAGVGVAGAGDVNNDGLDDMLVMPVDYNLGRVYLVLSPVPETFDLWNRAEKLVGEAPGDLAIIGAGAGDVDADGYDDLLIGAFGNDEGGGDAGAAYVVLGPVTGDFDLSLADAKLLGERGGNLAGSGVSGAGDVNSDGHDDLLIAPGYLMLGPVSGTIDLSLADAKFRDDGHWASEWFSGPGDVDADGYDDVLMGVPFDSDRGINAGGAYLVRGPVSGTLDLSRAADAKLVGERAEDYAGVGVSGAGDVDADGRADILVGSQVNGPGGAAYLLYGAGL